MALTIPLAVGIVAAGVLVGILSAMFGVGGGILIVPFMVIALDQGQHVSEGTSLLVIVPTAVAGVLAHRRRGYVSFRHAALLAAGGIGGAYLGALVALEMRASVLQTLFGLLMAYSGIRVVLRGIAKIRGERRGEEAPAPDQEAAI